VSNTCSISMPKFSVGIDCEDIQRWRTKLANLGTGPQQKLFTKREHQYCNSFNDPAPHYAVRWCAKEALLKAAAPYYKLDLRKIEVANNKDGTPYFIINEPGFNKLNLIVSVSLSHSSSVGMAVAILTSSMLNSYKE
jgi:holo-[acyl-carrier protein] synthase